MAYGSEADKRRYLPKLASGEEIWCQLFSEPAGGSDVAGLRTRAERDGDRLDHQRPEDLDLGRALFRLRHPDHPHRSQCAQAQGPDDVLPRHEEPGVEVKPIKQANGMQEFNEVYFTDVRVPDQQRLGAVGDGWNVSLTTLMNERLSIGARLATGFPEMFEFCSNLMTDDGLAIDDRGDAFETRRLGGEGQRAEIHQLPRDLGAVQGRASGPENSIGKLVSGTMLQDIAMYAMDLQGAAGVLTDADDRRSGGQFQEMLLSSPSMRIAGGTDEILRNIIAERVLGLPGDIRVDKDVPFNKIPTKGR